MSCMSTHALTPLQPKLLFPKSSPNLKERSARMLIHGLRRFRKKAYGLYLMTSILPPVPKSEITVTLTEAKYYFASRGKIATFHLESKHRVNLLLTHNSCCLQVSVSRTGQWLTDQNCPKFLWLATSLEIL